VNSFLLVGRPRRLVLVSIGNSRNEALEHRLFAELPAIVTALSGLGFVEVTNSGLVIHDE
jgi:hypothetical protein